MAYAPKMTEEEKAQAQLKKEMLQKIRMFGLALTPEKISHWFDLNDHPSPTLFALDFAIDPTELGERCKDTPMVRDAMYRIIGMAEEQLYWRVFGPKAVVQRVETLMSGKSSISDAEVNGEDGTDGLFVSA